MHINILRTYADIHTYSYMNNIMN